MNPMQVWMYVMSCFITIPGTDTNVIPLTDAPTSPKASMYHGDLRSPR